MAQFARPDLDGYPGTGYKNQAASTSNLFQAVDEAIQDDSDYVISTAAPSASPVVFRLSSVTDPVSAADHKIRFSYRADLSAQQTVTIQRDLYQGYSTEASKGTLIHSTSVTTNTTAWVTSTFTLGATAANAITNYGDLWLRFEMTSA